MIYYCYSNILFDWMAKRFKIAFQPHASRFLMTSRRGPRCENEKSHSNVVNRWILIKSYGNRLSVLFITTTIKLDLIKDQTRVSRFLIKQFAAVTSRFPFRWPLKRKNKLKSVKTRWHSSIKFLSTCIYEPFFLLLLTRRAIETEIM